MKKEPMTTGEIARYCHVSVRAVLKWIEEGKLVAYRTPGKHSRVSQEDFMDFLRKFRMPVPGEFQKGDEKKRILIVDDDKELVRSLRRSLEEENKYQISTAYNGFIAGQRFCSSHPDLVILDIKMPGLDGFQVCSYIRNDLGNKEVKILVMSGLIGTIDTNEVLNMGVDDVLAKPFEESALMAKIRNLLGEEASAEVDNDGSK